MITKAVVLVPPRPSNLLHTDVLNPLVHMGGITLIQRILYSLQWAGIEEGFLLSLGELFTLVAYGQLIIENTEFYNVEDQLLDQIFDFMIRDFSKFALQMYAKPSSTEQQMAIALKMVRKANVDPERFNYVWEKHVANLNGSYEMNP